MNMNIYKYLFYFDLHEEHCFFFFLLYLHLSTTVDLLAQKQAATFFVKLGHGIRSADAGSRNKTQDNLLQFASLLHPSMRIYARPIISISVI